MRKLCVSLMALVAVFFVSCSTETDIIEENDGGKDVTLTISTSPLTKSLDVNQFGQTAPIDYTKDLYVYFMNSSDVTVASYKLTDTQITNIKTAGTGVTFRNLDQSVEKVYVVANVPKTGVTMLTAPTTTFANVNATVMYIKDQQEKDAASVVLANDSKTVTNLIELTGQGATASNGNKNYKADIKLTPIVSRIQIKKVSVDADETISSFKLLGIYVDNYYPSMTIGGDFSSITINKASGPADFAATSAPYNTTLLFNADEATGLTQSPTPQVYGYQFFPTTGTDLSNVPYIILKLTNVKKSDTATRDISPSTTYYVAVKAYKDETTSAGVTTFLPGKIYTIADIPVSERNLVTDPTQSLINVTVNVTIANWSSQALKPDFGY